MNCSGHRHFFFWVRECHEWNIPARVPPWHSLSVAAWCVSPVEACQYIKGRCRQCSELNQPHQDCHVKDYFFFPFVLVAQMSLDKVSGSDTFRKQGRRNTYLSEKTLPQECASVTENKRLSSGDSSSHGLALVTEGTLMNFQGTTALMNLGCETQ